jgi:hypothetical protein
MVNKAEMKFKEFDLYHSYYCGLCRKLKEKYGFSGQLSLNYDMTFLLLLLTGLYEPETVQGEYKCAAHPFGKQTVRTNQFTEYVADMNILLTQYQCKDDWEDEKRLPKFLYGKTLERKNKKLKAIYGKKIRSINLLLYDLAVAEKENKLDVDAMSGIFGKVMAQLVVCREDEWGDTLYRFGFYLGKFIYLLDAYEDIEKDIRKGTYNPLKRMYHALDFEEECRTILTMMMSECCKEFEKLPILENVEILRNILYSGVWCRYETVREKRNRKKGADMHREVGEKG